MYNILKHAHSGLRWVALALLIFTVINALRKWLSKTDTFTEGDRKLNVFTLISVHVQLLIGVALLFISKKVSFGGDMMKNEVLRFFTMEHSLTMIIAVVLVTVGNARSKKSATASSKFKTTLIFYGIALLLILAMIPWPSKEGFGAGWY